MALYESEKKLKDYERYSDGLSGAVKIGTSLYAGMTDKKALKETYKYNSGIRAYNRQMIGRAMDDAYTSAGVERTDLNLRARLDQGQARADAAARGVDVNTGSAADIVTGMMDSQRVDQERVQANVFKEARAMYDQVYRDQQEQKMEKALMRAKLKANKTDTISSMFSGVSGVMGLFQGSGGGGGGFFSSLFGGA